MPGARVMPPGSNNLDGGSVTGEYILKAEMPVERQQIGDEWYQKCNTEKAGRRRGLFGPAPAQAAADACSGVLHPVIWLPDGTMAACRATFSPAHGNAAREKLYQQQSSISSMLKCSLWLLQITKDRTETISMHLFRSWSSCRSGCLPGCSLHLS